MAKILRKILTVGLMVCVGSALYPAAAPGRYGLAISVGDFNIGQEEYDSFSDEERTKYIDTCGGVQAALFQAVENGRIWAFEPLIEKGADIQCCRPRSGVTVLHIGAFNGNVEVVRFFVERGARLDAVNHSDETALHKAIYMGYGKIGGCQSIEKYEEIVRILVNAGAMLDVVNHNGDTALHMAAGAGHGGIVRILVEAGARVDLVDKWKNTALVHVQNRALEVQKNVIKWVGVEGCSQLLIDRFREQLDQWYPTREYVLLSDDELVKLGGIGQLDHDVTGHIMDLLEIRDFGRMACVSRAYGKFVNNEMCRRLPRIKGEKFAVYVGRALEVARNRNRQMVPLLEQELGKGYALAVQQPMNPSLLGSSSGGIGQNEQAAPAVDPGLQDEQVVSVVDAADLEGNQTDLVEGRSVRKRKADEDVPNAKRSKFDANSDENSY